MTIEQQIKAWSELGRILSAHANEENWHPGISFISEAQYYKFEESIALCYYKNGWFEDKAVRISLSEISNWLQVDKLKEWLEKYPLTTKKDKTIAIIMAGNIPLVGFHDLLSVIFAGFQAKVKMSSDDQILLPAILEYLQLISPELTKRISFTDRKIGDFDAIIATGDQLSNQTFLSYFSSKPHLFRGNRTSIAVITGEETFEELSSLGKDVFQYFGKGCRNVTHLCVPKGYVLDNFFHAIFDFSAVIQNKKYGNNYDYNKAIHLLNLEPILDNNFLLLKKTEALHAPIAMLYYHEYESHTELINFIQKNESEIQCIVGIGYIPFGNAQKPALQDYADNKDTMNWLFSLPL